MRSTIREGGQFSSVLLQSLFALLVFSSLPPLSDYPAGPKNGTFPEFKTALDLDHAVDEVLVIKMMLSNTL